MKNFFSSQKFQDQGFKDFLASEKFSFSNFFFIYTGALLTCFLLGGYLGVLTFTPFLSLGNFLLIWAGWLVLSFPLSRQQRFERIVLWSNNIIISFLFFYLVSLSPVNWIAVLLPYFIFSLLLINFMQGNFFPVIDSGSLGFWGILGLLHFYITQSAIFKIDESALLIFLFLIIMAVSGASFFIWGGIRSKKSLYKIYSQSQELKETAAVLEIRIKAKTRELQEQSRLLREENRLKTEALRRRIDELERFRHMVVGRELKMVELKEKISQLKKELGQFKKGQDEK